MVTVLKYHLYQSDDRLNDKLVAGSSQADDSEIATDKNVRIKECKNNIKTPADKSAPKSTGTRLPDNWFLSQEYFEAAKEIKPELNDPQIQGIADEFRDYWISKSGKDATKVNWLATWRNWIRKQRNFGGQNGQAGYNSNRKESLAERSHRETQAALAKIEAEEASLGVMGANDEPVRPQVGQSRGTAYDGGRNLISDVPVVVQKNGTPDR